MVGAGLLFGFFFFILEPRQKQIKKASKSVSARGLVGVLGFPQILIPSSPGLVGCGFRSSSVEEEDQVLSLSLPPLSCFTQGGVDLGRDQRAGLGTSKGRSGGDDKERSLSGCPGRPGHAWKEKSGREEPGRLCGKSSFSLGRFFSSLEPPLVSSG